MIPRSHSPFIRQFIVRLEFVSLYDISAGISVLMDFENSTIAFAI